MEAAMMPKKKILVIDDEEHIRDSLGFMLEKMGYLVQTEADASRVFEILESESFDIVLSDVTMPKLNGHELTRRLRKKYPDIHVILISGFREDELQYSAGADGTRPHNYLTKPFSMSDLQGCLESI